MFTTTIRLDEDFNEKVRIAMAKRRVRSLQLAVEQALEMWLAQDDLPRPKGGAGPELGDVTDIERRYAEHLIEYARSHTQDAVDVVLAAIEFDKARKK